MQRSADWFEQAQWDLAHAEHVVGAGFHDWACFSSQQAAEKACKAVLQSFGADVWGHSVADLLEAIGERASVAEELTDIALELDKAYIPTRYPDAHPSGSPSTRYTKREAERMISFAKQITTFCQSLLPGAQ
jgi:HEPN domain-containing protein